LNTTRLCEQVFSLEDTLACTIVDPKGHVLSSKSKGLGEQKGFASNLGDIVAVIWGGIRGTVHIGGELRTVIVEFEKFKSVGIPLASNEYVVLVTVPVSTDVNALRDRVLEIAKLSEG
jgi:hypothetical protein